MTHPSRWQKFKERRRLARKARATRDRAYAVARGLCAAVGPEGIAEEYPGADLASGPDQIAYAYAATSYRKEVRAAARRGARDGFADYEKQRRSRETRQEASTR